MRRRKHSQLSIPAAYDREFHVSRSARDRYLFDESLFSVRGTIALANFRAARQFTQRVNERHDLLRFPEQAVKAGQINAMALIHELMHLMILAYRQQGNPGALSEGLAYVESIVGEGAVQSTEQHFTDEFPAPTVYQGNQTAEQYLAGQTGEDPNQEVVLEEMLLLWLSNNNPAFSPYREFFDDSEMARETAYREVVDGLREFFAEQPAFGPGGMTLIDLLEAPAKASPHSLSGQLEYIRENWAPYLGKSLYRLLAGLDLIAEEEKPIFFGPGPSSAPDFAHLDPEPERFSHDKFWMPKVVMLSKNAFVWLDQLSKACGEKLYRLDQIPDEALDTLARSGFNGLWLIGLWERSKASRRIKQMMGNPEAVASAYSLYDYQIADDLGGYEAYEDLRDRAWQRGIRLASDMVPNHVGIDGRWVFEQPDWFISLDYSPFPSYTFDGPDLSEDGRVGIYLEDHYYTRSDAAVVFKRVDRWTGDTKYVYHGNDGTSMPWNDTAQLNYLNAEVREGVIQTILHVARMFPIIRFDAAMTLAKRHYQRLWFPEPGSGGDIPSRAEYGLSKEQFNEAFPEEFWREVVDRIAAEVPDTLLLAEAFWMMEGYFVRTLGMHRVYNSAFMNMLKNEENAKYRSVIKNTVEFDPEILKRYVNFMNNPDEDTAVAQFGEGDKYFGTCTLLATMPGLPMFGHGQVEGYTEKYGMEYRKAYYDETPKQWLVERHEREIFPLLHKRYLFAGVGNFLLYDFFNADGSVNEDVFAYSNQVGEERGLVVYHNKWAEAGGWIRASAAYAVKGPDGEKHLEQKTLAQGLVLPSDNNAFVIFRDQVTGQEYIRNCAQLHDEGMFIELGAFKYHVFLDFRVVHDDQLNRYRHLMGYLDGRGVPNIEEAMAEIVLQPVLEPFRSIANGHVIQRVTDMITGEESVDGAFLVEVSERAAGLAEAAANFADTGGDSRSLAGQMSEELGLFMSLPDLAEEMPELKATAAVLKEHHDESIVIWGTALGWLMVHDLGQVVDPDDPAASSRSLIDEWLLGRQIAAALQEAGLDEGIAWHAVSLIKVLASHQDWFDVKAPAGREALVVLTRLLRDRDVQRFLQVNRHQGVLWFNKEAYEQLRAWLMLPAILDALSGMEEDEARETIAERYAILQKLAEAGRESGYRIETLLEAAR